MKKKIQIQYALAKPLHIVTNNPLDLEDLIFTSTGTAEVLIQSSLVVTKKLQLTASKMSILSPSRISVENYINIDVQNLNIKEGSNLIIDSSDAESVIHIVALNNEGALSISGSMNSHIEMLTGAGACNMSTSGGTVYFDSIEF